MSDFDQLLGIELIKLYFIPQNFYNSKKNCTFAADFKI